MYQTWARPNLIDGAFATSTDDVTGDITRSTDLSEKTHYTDLEGMTADLVAGYLDVANQASADGTAGFAGIAPVGEAFLRAVQSGVATRDIWASDALSDGLIDLWFDDGTHASAYGSYLSSLVLFGTLTGLDPAQFGENEIAAFDLGIGSREAFLLQRVASDQLGYTAPAPVPLPATAPMAAVAFALLGLMARGRRKAA